MDFKRTPRAFMFSLSRLIARPFKSYAGYTVSLVLYPLLVSPFLIFNGPEHADCPPCAHHAQDQRLHGEEQ